MAIAILTTLPAQFFAGDTVKVRVANAGFPAPEWKLKLAFNGPTQFAKVAEADGAAHLFNLATADTAAQPSGVYGWAIVAEAGGERATLYEGNIWLKPNPAVETLSFAQEALQLIQAHIKGRLPAGLAAHTINGNQISKIPLPEAERLRDKYRGEVAAENRLKLSAAGDDGSTQIYFAR